MRFATVLSLIAATALTTACTDAPTAAVNGPSLAHESNNRATLSGMQDGRAILGTAIINYVSGTEGWRSTVNLSGDLAAGTYTFFAISPNGMIAMPVCSFTISETGGRQGCTADTDLGGFLRAEVRESDGTVVASGTFQRRGGNRPI